MPLTNTALVRRIRNVVAILTTCVSVDKWVIDPACGNGSRGGLIHRVKTRYYSRFSTFPTSGTNPHFSGNVSGILTRDFAGLLDRYPFGYLTRDLARHAGARPDTSNGHHQAIRPAATGPRMHAPDRPTATLVKAWLHGDSPFRQQLATNELPSPFPYAHPRENTRAYCL